MSKENIKMWQYKWLKALKQICILRLMHKKLKVDKIKSHCTINRESESFHMYTCACSFTIHHYWYASACELTIPSTRSYPNKWELYHVIEIHLILVLSCQKSILEIASLLLTVMWISQQIGESWIYFFVTHLYKWELNLICTNESWI